MLIAIDSNDQLVYQGHTAGYGYGLWPQPALSFATLVPAELDLNGLPPDSHLHSADLLFREDTFDPVTRIRRGRLYRVLPFQPTSWSVSPPGVQPYTDQRSIQLYGFDSNLVGTMHVHVNKTLLALGTRDAHTLWRIVACERIVSGEDLLALRARTSFGTLPELDESKVPPEHLAKVKETLEKLAAAAYRSGPESIVDLARGAAQWCIATWQASQKGDPALLNVDLGQWPKRLQEHDLNLLAGIAGAIARLHSRAKPNEQHKHQSRPVIEDDAEFALASVGMLLREIGWAV